MKASSQDLRQRVLRAIDQGKSQAKVAQTFAISISTIKRYRSLRRESGHILPKPILGRPSVKGAALQAGLLEQLRTPPDATREEHCQMWEASQGIKVCPVAKIWEGKISSFLNHKRSKNAWEHSFHLHQRC